MVQAQIPRNCASWRIATAQRDAMFNIAHNSQKCIVADVVLRFLPKRDEALRQFSKSSFLPLDRRRTSSPSSNSSSPSRGFPSFRFTTADEEITEILDDIDADTAEEEDSKLRIEFKGLLSPLHPMSEVSRLSIFTLTTFCIFLLRSPCLYYKRKN